MQKILFAVIILFTIACGNNEQSQQPAGNELRSVEGTERHNVQKSDTSTKENANERNTVSPEPPGKHGL